MATSLLCACGGPPATSRTPRLPTPTASIDPYRAAEVAVLAAYRREEAAFEDAIRRADPDVPELPATMVDPLLKVITDNLRANQTAGIVADNGKIDHNPRVVSISDASAVVADCEWDAAALVYEKSGQKVPPIVPAERVGVRATLVEAAPGVWKVSQREVTEGSCPSSP